MSMGGQSVHYHECTHRSGAGLRVPRSLALTRLIDTAEHRTHDSSACSASHGTRRLHIPHRGNILPPGSCLSGPSQADCPMAAGHTAMSAQTLPAQESRLPDDALRASSEAVFGVAEQITVDLSEDGIVEVTLPPNTVVRSPEAQAAAAAVRAFADGRRLPLLLTVTGVLSVTNDARLAYTDSMFVSACALLGESPVDRVIAHYLLRARSDSVPARFFTSEAEARDWLRERHRES